MRGNPQEDEPNEVNQYLCIVRALGNVVNLCNDETDLSRG